METFERHALPPSPTVLPGRRRALAMLAVGVLPAAPVLAQPGWLARLRGAPASAAGDSTESVKPAAVDGPAAGSADCPAEGPISMPSGVDMARLALLDENKRMAIYTGLADIDSTKPEKQRLPDSMRAVVELSGDQVMRMFSDAVMSSRRFQVFHSKLALTNAYSNLLADLMVTSAAQRFVPIEPGRRVVQSTVSLSLNLTDVTTGSDAFGAAIEVEGRTGTTSGGRMVLTSADDPASADVKRRLGEDYVQALKLGLFEIRLELESRLRPMAKVLEIDGCAVGVAGGQLHGLAKGDKLVVFRSSFVERGGTRLLGLPKTVAVLLCEGVGSDSTICRVLQYARNMRPAVDDYAVITDQSLASGVSRPR